MSSIRRPAGVLSVRKVSNLDALSTLAEQLRETSVELVRHVALFLSQPAQANEVTAHSSPDENNALLTLLQFEAS